MLEVFALNVDGEVVYKEGCVGVVRNRFHNVVYF